MKNILPYLLLFFPFQNLAIGVATTKFDVFPVVLVLLLMAEVLIFERIKYISKNQFYKLSCFIIISVLIWILLHYAPISRFLSALFWLSSLLFVYFSATKLYSDNIYKSVIITCLISCLVVLFQFTILRSDRPKAFFQEPSTAGLIFFSLAIVMMYRIVYRNHLKKSICDVTFLLLFLVCGFLTKSSHVVLVFLLPFLFVLYGLTMKNFIKVSLGLGTFFILMMYIVLNNEYFVEKFDFRIIENFNLSQLAWLRGGEQAVYVAKHSPVFGFGLGSTGCFNFNSQSAFYLDKLDSGNLNLLDAYSLMFRLIIEVGLLTLLFILYILHNKIKRFMKNFRDRTEPISLDKQSLFVFGLSIFIGSLIKEPNYGVGPLFVSVLCLGYDIKGLGGIKNNGERSLNISRSR
ncbi:hypothetical protein FW774_05230 (plasmid) [Pedobacter sp. BS3]|uniref:hypothetical protein n=1 Tax=Pedobacter sp. BS3 TaxID=2567937 RepID=UPI0011EDCA22|nr:hypothetical protein [Pedobacter sp. BS3]TZF86447.1 hypothetical protein FW774_05230 [Pedobacter sp. BS3]